MVCSTASLERKHKVKFDPMELEVLVDEANQQQRKLSVSQRNTTWEEICEKVKRCEQWMKRKEDIKASEEEHKKNWRIIKRLQINQVGAQSMRCL